MTIQTNTTATIHNDSIRQFCPDYEVMVYGFDHCDFGLVMWALEEKGKYTYHNCLGYDNDPTCSDYPIRLDGRKVCQINAGLTAEQKNNKDTVAETLSCKAALVNIVLENFHSRLRGEKIVPIIFCIDITNNRFPFTAEAALSKTKTILKNGETECRANDLVTHKELRRAYKLCQDPELPLKFREIARDSFKFVRVKKMDKTGFSKAYRQYLPKFDFYITLQALPAPWEAKDWDAEWTLRKASSQVAPKEKTAPWRKEVLAVLIKQGSFPS